MRERQTHTGSDESTLRNRLAYLARRRCGCEPTAAMRVAEEALRQAEKTATSDSEGPGHLRLLVRTLHRLCRDRETTPRWRATREHLNLIATAIRLPERRVELLSILLQGSRRR